MAGLPPIPNHTHTKLSDCFPLCSSAKIYTCSLWSFIEEYWIIGLTGGLALNGAGDRQKYRGYFNSHNDPQQCQPCSDSQVNKLNSLKRRGKKRWWRRRRRSWPGPTGFIHKWKLRAGNRLYLSFLDSESSASAWAPCCSDSSSSGTGGNWDWPTLSPLVLLSFLDFW